MVYYGPHDGSSCESEVISMPGVYIYIYIHGTSQAKDGSGSWKCLGWPRRQSLLPSQYIGQSDLPNKALLSTAI